jgi:hypothetical protein
MQTPNRSLKKKTCRRMPRELVLEDDSLLAAFDNPPGAKAMPATPAALPFYAPIE